MRQRDHRFLFAALWAVFCALYLVTGWRLHASPLLVHDNLLFGSDRHEVREILSGVRPGRFASIKHPLFPLFTSPEGAVVRRLLESKERSCASGAQLVHARCATVLAAAFTALCAPLLCGFALNLGVRARAAVLVACCNGLAAGVWLWGAAAETHPFAAPGICLALYLASRHAPPRWSFLAASVYLVGVNVTGAAYAGLVHLARRSLPPSVRFLPACGRSARLIAITLGVSCALFAVQSGIYPHRPLWKTWNSDVKASVRVTVISKPGTISKRLESVVAHQCVYDVVAPDVKFVNHWPMGGARPADDRLKFATFGLSLNNQSPLFLAGIAVWLAVFAAAVTACLLAPTRLFLFGVACPMVFNLVLFTGFGLPQEQFLYAPNHVPFLAAILACGLAASRAAHPRLHRVLEVGLVLLLAAEVALNLHLMHTIAGAFLGP